MLVAAVLGPQDGEDRELEVVRRAAEQLADALELPVGETESAMERLLGKGLLGGYCSQEASLALRSDGPCGDRGGQRPRRGRREPVPSATPPRINASPPYAAASRLSPSASAP